MVAPSPPAVRAAATPPRLIPDLPEEVLLRCVHCGFCLPTCPTYAETGLEPDSPRGRIHLIRSVAEGRLTFSPAVVRHLSLCLDCRACETACPAGVEYGRLIEPVRAAIERARPGGPLRRLARRVALDGLLPHPRALRLAGWFLRLYQGLGLQTLLRRSGLLRLLPTRLAAAEALLPALAPDGGGALPERVPAEGERVGRVAFLHGCVQDVIFRHHNRATLRLLARNGYEVVVPRGQRCCGALHAHAGSPERARALARVNIAVFEAAGAETLVVNAAGCGAHLKQYDRLLHDDPDWASRARALARTVADVTEVLARRPLRGPLGPVPLRVTYHDPCHLAHGQRVRTEPRALLRAIPGLGLVDLAESELCCGSAGIYNLTEPEMAERLLARKVRHLVATGAEAVVTANPGCLLQIAAGLRARGVPMRVYHVVELLDRAYRAGGA